MPFQLRITRGNGEGQQFVVVQSVVRIGRDDDNDVVLSDVGVSRQHTRIFEKQGRYFAEDLGSANGTLVNGASVSAPRELKSGDALGIGAALLSFVELDEPQRNKVMPSVPVSRADTGEHPLPGRPGMLPPPPVQKIGDDDIVTASGEHDPSKDKRSLYDASDAEITAPVGKPLSFGDDSTVPVATPLKMSPDSGLSVATQPVPDPRKAAATTQPFPEMKSGPSLVPASTLKRAFDVSEQKTSLAVPQMPEEKPGPPVAMGDSGPQPSINRLLRDAAPVEPGSDSLAPLELSKSELQALNEATRADAPALPPVDESTALGKALPKSAIPNPRVTSALPARESAAERARRRRQAGESLGAQALYVWNGWALKTRAAIAAGSGLSLSLVIIALIRFFSPEPGPELPPEPDRLTVTRERVHYFFGYGEGVEYLHVDSKEFVFDFVTPTEAAVLLHYQAQEIDRDEVSIAVNGAEIGFVPPDIGVPDRELEALVPQRVLKRGERNSIVFDNVRNPPGKERWRVGEIWLEVLPVPPATAAEAIRRARELGRQAGQLYAQREVGQENVFRSWRAYRLAWQVLLAVPEEQRTSLFEQMRRKSDELAQELDRQCGALMLEAKKQMELKNPDRAKEILESVAGVFPNNEHRCHALAMDRIAEYQL